MTLTVDRGIDHARVEGRIGRQLTASERHINVEQIDRLLNRTKDELEQAIKDEQHRVARQIARGRPGRLEVTGRMRRLLKQLRTEGRAHALAELESLGYPARAHAAVPEGEPPPHRARLAVVPTQAEIEALLEGRLVELTRKVRHEALGLDLTTLAQAAIERALVRVLGARAVAADLVSPAFVAGLGDTFEQHTDLVDGWQYTAVNDSGLCDQCAPLDGTTYPSTDALFEVLPGFGPNPLCLGGDRCRCRAVPLAVGG